MSNTTGVLYTDDINDTAYHILHTGGITRDVLVSDRRAKDSDYTTLIRCMDDLHITQLWVSPDTLFSLWVMRSDFDLVREYNHFTPGEVLDGHPYGVRFYRGARNWIIYYPAHMRLAKKTATQSPLWNIPDQFTLFNSVTYLEQATGAPFEWTPGNSSREILRSTHERGGIIPFAQGALWNTAHKSMVTRPIWVCRDRESKKQGLSEAQQGKKYIHKFDKNVQFLGACVKLRVPNGPYIEASPDRYIPGECTIQGFWEYQLLDVSRSLFNSYDCYCPLSSSRQWASTSVLNEAYKAGIKFAVKRGLVWEENNMGGELLSEWARRLYRARAILLHNEEKYPDRIAAHNAANTVKKYYIDMIGQFCSEYAGEYYHREWNELVIHESIARQMATLSYRSDSLRGSIAMVCNDAIYLLSDERDPQEAYPDFMAHSLELRGYKHGGVCEVTPELVRIFRECKPLDIEFAFKQRNLENEYRR